MEISIDPPIRLTHTPVSDWARYPSMLLDDSGKLCIAWYVYPKPESGKTCQIYFASAFPDRASLARLKSVQVSNDRHINSGPTLAQDREGRYWIAWHIGSDGIGSRYIGLSHSEDGSDWSPAKRTFPQLYQLMYYPSLIHDHHGTFWMTLTCGADEQRTQVFISQSADGHTWLEPRRLPHSIQGDNRSDIAMSPEGRLWIIWRSARKGPMALWLSQSLGDDSWSEPQRLPFDFKDLERPRLSFDPTGTLLVTFEAEDSVWVSRAAGNGGWSDPNRISDRQQCETRTSVIVYDRAHQPWVAWTSDRDGTDIWAASLDAIQ